MSLLSKLKSLIKSEAKAKKAAYIKASNSLHWNPNLRLPKSIEQELNAELKKNNLKVSSWEIHPNDMMFHFHLLEANGDLRIAVLSHFQIGMNLTNKLKEILNSNHLKTDKFLDFGSGYARVSRFFPAIMPLSSIYVSEVKKQSLDFQKEKFNFNTVLHSTDANSFNEEGFSFILAVSVFTHLPQKDFEEWMSKLLNSLGPKGAILFTYNDLDLFLKKFPKAADKVAGDFHYAQDSEDHRLSHIPDSLKDTKSYGSTFVRYNYLESLIPSDFGIISLGFDFTPAQSSLLVIRK